MDCQQVRDQLRSALGTTYAIERELGGGGMSCVFLAHDTALDAAVVIKVLPPGLGGVVNFARFRHEIRIAARLNHPNIVSLIDAGQDGDLLYYTMRWVNGPSLRDRLRKEGSLPIADVVKILCDLLSALEHAHGDGVVHRDIKPANVLLAGRHAYLTDFGVAKTLSDTTPGDALTSAGIVLGTPAYMAPEQIAGDGTANARMDIYAIGVLAYEMLAGRTPFESGGTAQEVMAAHLTATPVRIERLRTNVPAGLADLVMWCLEKRPADRPQSARELLARVDALLPPMTSGRRDMRWLPAIARMPVARGVFAVGIAVVGVLIWDHNGQGEYNPRTVAVIPFSNLSSDTTLATWGGVVAEQLTSDIANAYPGSAHVSDPMAIRAGRVPGSTSQGRRTAATDNGAGLVVTGTYQRIGDRLVFRAQLHAEPSDRLMASADPVMGPLVDPARALFLLDSDVVTRLAIIFNIATFPVPPPSQRPRLDAYHEYERGAEAWVRLERPSAIPHLLRASQLDTTFAEPVLGAAIAFEQLQRWRSADSLLRVLEGRHLNLSAFETHTADWVRASFDGDRAARRDAIFNANADQPGSFIVRYQVAQELFGLGDPCASLDTMRRIDPHGAGWYVYYDYLTRGEHMLGYHGAERRSAEQGMAEYPRLMATLYYAARAAAGGGDLDRVSRLLDSARGMPPQLGFSPAVVARLIALELRAHGHRDSATAVLTRVIDAAHTRPSSERASESFRFELAKTLYQAGRWVEARALFDSLSAQAPDSLPYRGYTGVLAARRHDTATANRITAEMDSWPQPYTRGENLLWSARIAALLGDRQLALERLADALPKAGWEIERHVDMDLESLRDEPRYRLMLGDKSCGWLARLDPRN